MTLYDFQRALADCVADGSLRDAARQAPDTALAGYALSPRERARLAAAVAHPGMPVTVGLYRANRLTVIHGSLPLTCTLLGDMLRAVVDAYWAHGAPPDLQHASEAARFAEFLRARLEVLGVPWLAEVLAFEMAALELTLPAAPQPPSASGARLHPRVRLVRFGTAPDVLLARVAATQPTDDLVPAERWLLLDGRSGAVEARELTTVMGWTLAAVSAGATPGSAAFDALVAAGVVSER